MHLCIYCSWLKMEKRMGEMVYGMETLLSWSNDLGLISGTHKGEGEKNDCKNYFNVLELHIQHNSNRVHRHTYKLTNKNRNS